MHFRRQSKYEDSVNLTPLIDVVFLLLIFFMVSTTFTKETHLKLELPEAEGERSDEQPEVIEITINASGGYAVNGQTIVNAKLNTLMTAIDEASQGDTDMPFLITADAKVPYQSVVTVMDAASRMGYANISLTTVNPEGQAPAQ